MSDDEHSDALLLAEPCGSQTNGGEFQMLWLNIYANTCIQKNRYAPRAIHRESNKQRRPIPLEVQTMFPKAAGVFPIGCKFLSFCGPWGPPGFRTLFSSSSSN
jgi:hypothetical protein